MRKRFVRLAFVAALTGCGQEDRPAQVTEVPVPAVVVSTYAGNGLSGDVNGTGGPHGTAEFAFPQGVAVDPRGNVYVADVLNNAIRKIDAAGNVTTLAGNGIAGAADGTGGDHGTAEFTFPTGVAVDAEGNVFVAGDNRVRKIDPEGNVTTLAGNGLSGSVDGTGGPWGSAEFENPWAVAVDVQDNVYVADYVANRIRKIDAAGNVTTLAGNGIAGSADGTGGANGTAELRGPQGVAVDGAGNVYVADTDNQLIRRIDAAGNVTTIAGDGTSGDLDGTGTSAELSFPQGIALDGQGNLYVADYFNLCIRRIDSAGNVGTLAGNGQDGNTNGAGGSNGVATFGGPTGVAVDAAGHVFVADPQNSEVREITLQVS